MIKLADKARNKQNAPQVKLSYLEQLYQMWLKIIAKRFSHHFFYSLSSFVLTNGNAVVEAIKNKLETSRVHISSLTAQNRNAVKIKSIDLDPHKYWGIKNYKIKDLWTSKSRSTRDENLFFRQLKVCGDWPSPVKLLLGHFVYSLRF